ncbi:hypothetical protein OSTOST_21066 [Ostertagia ostertagi]
MSNVARIAESCSSDSDEDLYTHSIDIKKVRGVAANHSTFCGDHRNGDSGISRTPKPDIIALDDDDSDSLDLSDPENICPKKAKESSRKRRERMEREQLQELEKIMHEPIVVDRFVPAKTRKITPLIVDSSHSSEILNDSIESVESIAVLPSKSKAVAEDVIDLDKEVDLYVTVNVDHQAGKPGRFMTIRRLAVVNVFSLKSDSTYEEDYASDPNFIAIKCIFANGRPRCVYISLTETFSEAKKRISKELKLAKAIAKLVFDSEVLSDDDSPESVGMEADDVIEIYLKD